jgi:sugar-specific transcriptional regulator TrmB
MEKVENLLREFGLTEYEVRAFVTLLKLEIATAEQISGTGNIPLPRVYDTLSELKKKGFVLISRTRPKKFKPLSPEKALNNLIKIKRANFEDGIKNLEKSVKNIKEVLAEIEPVESPKEESITVWSTEKRRNVIKSLNEQLDSAKKEVLCFAGDISWFPEAIDPIKNALKRNIEISILAKELKNSKEFLKNINKAKKLGLKIKTGYEGTLRGYIIDGEKISLAIKTSEKGVNIAEDGLPKSDEYRKYELITIENSVLATALKENFKFWWSKLR